MNNVNEDKSLNIVMTEPQIWGRRVMFAVLSLVVAIPLVNMRRLMTEGLPIGLERGEINYAYVIGMFFLVLLILVWYFVYTGRSRARVMLGVVYLLTTSVTVVVPITLMFMGTVLPPRGPLPSVWRRSMAWPAGSCWFPPISRRFSFTSNRFEPHPCSRRLPSRFRAAIRCASPVRADGGNAFQY